MENFSINGGIFSLVFVIGVECSIVQDDEPSKSCLNCILLEEGNFLMKYNCIRFFSCYFGIMENGGEIWELGYITTMFDYEFISIT